MKITGNPLRQWRTAASLIVAAKTQSTGTGSSVNAMPSPRSRSASCSGPAPGTRLSQSRFDYNLLMLKRSGKSKFMPSAYVFPGGKLSESDYDKEWLRVFRDAGAGDVTNTLLVASRNKLPPLFQEDITESDVSNDLAFRICAIRETFEESGVLISRTPRTDCKNTPAHKLPPEDLREWRDTVHKDASKFLDMCHKYGFVPDVWSLHLWGNWLTPTNMESMHSGRRFDTMFYLCCLPEARELLHDEKEIVSAEWHSPVNILQEFHSAKSYLAPPQIYEISRLCKFSSTDKLDQFSQERDQHGLERWMPVRMNCTDGMITVLPGADLYPEEPDMEGEYPPPDLNMSMEEVLVSTQQHHHIELRGAFDAVVRCSVSPTHGHVNPMLQDEFQETFGNSRSEKN